MKRSKRDPFALILVDLEDSLTAELDKLKAISELLGLASDEVQLSTVHATGELVGDSVRRMRTTLQQAAESRSKAR